MYLFVCLFLTIGPVASVVILRTSCRACLFLGSVLLTAAFVASSVANSVDTLILTYGIIGGNNYFL